MTEDLGEEDSEAEAGSTEELEDIREKCGEVIAKTVLVEISLGDSAQPSLLCNDTVNNIIK